MNITNKYDYDSSHRPINAAQRTGSEHNLLKKSSPEDKRNFNANQPPPQGLNVNSQ